MSLKGGNKETVNILGKEFENGQHIVIIIFYMLFLLFVWPLIIGSYGFISGIICFIPIIPANFFYELFGSIKFYRKVIYTLIIILTFIYTFFFLHTSFLTNISHYLVNLFFGYLVSRKVLFQEEGND